MTETSPDAGARPDLAAAVFTPQRIALIGLSSDPGSPAGRPLAFLRQAGCRAEVAVVNPRRAEVQGAAAYPSLAALPFVPDHAYVLLGTARVEQAVADCAAAGVSVVTVLADGYAEAGPDGAARQARLVEIARAAGMRLLGPNSMGVADLATGTLLTVNAIYAEPDPLAGPVGLISQSGSMMGGLISRARALGVGFSRVAGVGNEADLGVAELGRMMLDDPATEVILLFLETLRDADALARMAARAHDLGKPVIAFKLGRSALGAEMAVAHTGALLAEDAVIDAFLSDVGIARVTTLDGLVEAPMLFRGRRPYARPPGVGVITTTGGGGATVADRLALAGVGVVPPPAPVLAAVRATGLSVAAGPVLDLTLAGAGPDFVRPAVEAMARAPEVDLVLSVTGSSGRSAPERTVAPLAEADLGGKRLAAFVTPEAPATLARLTAAGIPAHRTPESTADAVGALARWRAPRVRGLARAPGAAHSAASGRVLDEAAALAFLAEAGVPAVARAVIDLGGRVGAAPTLPFAYPVALKVLSDRVPHKTEAGGVELGIAGPEALAAAAARIKARVEAHHPGLVVERLLAAPMVATLQEVLIGYRLDAQAGPVVTLAPGGVLVGLYDDKAVRCAPVDRATADEMIAEVRGLAPLRGHRGLAKGDLDALAGAIVALSRLASHHVTVLEAEANPVMVTSDGAVAADALVVLADGAAAGGRAAATTPEEDAR